MKLDINEVYHQYITKVVIFSIFLFKRQIRQPNVYKQSVIAYASKRLPWKIALRIDAGARLSVMQLWKRSWTEEVKGWKAL